MLWSAIDDAWHGNKRISRSDCCVVEIVLIGALENPQGKRKRDVHVVGIVWFPQILIIYRKFMDYARILKWNTKSHTFFSFGHGHNIYSTKTYFYIRRRKSFQAYLLLPILLYLDQWWFCGKFFLALKNQCPPHIDGAAMRCLSIQDKPKCENRSEKLPEDYEACEKRDG